MSDRSTIVTALGLILRRMSELAQSFGEKGEKPERARSEAASLQVKSQQLMALLNEHPAHSRR
jgi:hypothetical protein